jgi:hypothetical protein
MNLKSTLSFLSASIQGKINTNISCDEKLVVIETLCQMVLDSSATFIQLDPSGDTIALVISTLIDCIKTRHFPCRLRFCCLKSLKATVEHISNRDFLNKIFPGVVSFLVNLINNYTKEDDELIRLSFELLCYFFQQTFLATSTLNDDLIKKFIVVAGNIHRVVSEPDFRHLFPMEVSKFAKILLDYAKTDNGLCYPALSLLFAVERPLKPYHDYDRIKDEGLKLLDRCLVEIENEAISEKSHLSNLSFSCWLIQNFEVNSYESHHLNKAVELLKTLLKNQRSNVLSFEFISCYHFEDLVKRNSFPEVKNEWDTLTTRILKYPELFTDLLRCVNILGQTFKSEQLIGHFLKGNFEVVDLFILGRSICQNHGIDLALLYSLLDHVLSKCNILDLSDDLNLFYFLDFFICNSIILKSEFENIWKFILPLLFPLMCETTKISCANLSRIAFLYMCNETFVIPASLMAKYHEYILENICLQLECPLTYPNSPSLLFSLLALPFPSKFDTVAILDILSETIESSFKYEIFVLKIIHGLSALMAKGKILTMNPKIRAKLLKLFTITSIADNLTLRKESLFSLSMFLELNSSFFELEDLVWLWSQLIMVLKIYEETSVAESVLYIFNILLGIQGDFFVSKVVKELWPILRSKKNINFSSKPFCSNFLLLGKQFIGASRVYEKKMLREFLETCIMLSVKGDESCISDTKCLVSLLAEKFPEMVWYFITSELRKKPNMEICNDMSCYLKMIVSSIEQNV